MRQRAPWMTLSDNRIMELLREHGNLTPAAIEHFGGPSSAHASHRAQMLAKSGLIHQIVHGLYQITDRGVAYLDEEFDASDIPDPNCDDVE